MHFHLHIHALIYYVRHARQMGGSIRLFGIWLLMLLFGLLQFFTFKPAFTMTAMGENSPFIACMLSEDDAVGIRGTAADPLFGGVDPKDPAPPYALKKNADTAFHRLQPAIVMIPRMNRTPRPKSVYRCFTRAPGIA